MPSKKKTVAQLLAAAKLPERAVTVCLRGDLVAEFQRLSDQLDEHNEQKASDKRLSGSKKGAEIAKQMEAIRAKMRDESLELTLRAFRGSEWRALKGEHPLPDPPAAQDLVVMANAQTLFTEAIPKSIVDPVLSAEEWAELDEVLPGGEFQRLVDAVLALNENGVVIPKSRAASMALRMSDDD